MFQAEEKLFNDNKLVMTFKRKEASILALYMSQNSIQKEMELLCIVPETFDVRKRFSRRNL
jgi:hypothetical protein